MLLDRIRAVYAYPDSPDGPSSPVDDDTPKALPLSQRLRALQAELASLEGELADPTNPLIQREREELNVDPGELIRGLVDVRSRLDKIVREKEGRARLVDNLVHAGGVKGGVETLKQPAEEKEKTNAAPAQSAVQSLVDVDRRVEELEKVVGSSNTSLDEVSMFSFKLTQALYLMLNYIQSSPLPPPLLPMVTKLNSQLALLTQPRHLDSISRRLKLLLSDLDRASVAQQQHRRQSSQGNAGDSDSTAATHEQLLLIVNRIAPSLPQIPHILTRLRTLSTLHSAAGEFQDTLKDLEQEQRKVHAALQELQRAVETVEGSLESNKNVVKGNVQGLDGRVNDLLKRLEDVRRESQLQSSA